MRLRKIVAILLLVSLALTALTSCSSAEKLEAKAEKKLAKKPHVVYVDQEFTTADKSVAEVFRQLGEQEIKILVDGHNFAVEDRLSIDYGEGSTEFVNIYVVIGDMIYSDMSYISPSGKNSTKGRSSLTEEDALTIKEKASIIGGVDTDDFADVTVEKQDGGRLIRCASVTETSDVNVMLEKIMYSNLEGAAKSVGVSDVKLSLFIKNGRYETVALECDYHVSFGELEFDIHADFTLSYDYDAHVDIAIPENAGEYSDLELDKILNML